jgi:hypothetical protein
MKMKKNYLKLATRTCLLAITCMLATSALADITSNLHLHYTFDGLTAEQSEVPDVSGNNNAGTRMGGAYYVEGKFGDALRLETVNDYVYMPDGFMVGMEDITIAGWIYKDAANGWDRLVDFATNTDTNMFITTGGPGYVRFAIKNIQVRPAGEEHINGKALTFGRWNHIAVTIKYTNNIGLGILYVNGVEVGRNNNITLKPSDLGFTTKNYVGKSVYTADPSVVGNIDDLRIYKRALTAEDIAELLGVPDEITDCYNNLALDLPEDYEFTGLTADLTLPTTWGDSAVNISWTSSDTLLIDNEGKIVAFPEKYQDACILTASLSQMRGEEEFTAERTFIVKVYPQETEVNPIIAVWDFTEETLGTDEDGNVTVTDKSGNDFVGTCLGGARIVTMGESNPVSAMYIEQAGAYFDMGQEIGKAVAGLTDYTISVFYRKDSVGGVTWSSSAYGQWLYCFCNSNDLASDGQGGIFYEPYRAYHAVFTTNYGDETGVQRGQRRTPIGTWHNITYVQSGQKGTLYFDGEVAGSSDNVYIPAYALKAKGHRGTIHNYIGLPCYSGDPKLSKTHIAGLQIYGVALTQEDLQSEELTNISARIAALNTAYNENPEVVGPEFQQEYDALTLPDISALTEETVLTLPTQGTIEPAIKITWVSSQPEYVSNTGVVTQPKYFDKKIVLTATLNQGTTFKSKTFEGKVLVKGSGFTTDLIANFDFSKGSGTTVTDQGEFAFEGTLHEEAYIATIGEGDNAIKVLYLANGDGYFDMGKEIGKAVSGLTDYTVSVFFRKDNNQGELSQFTGYGQWLYGFANTNNLGGQAYGAMYYEPLRDRHVCTPDNYDAEPNNHVGVGEGNTFVGSWHNITFTQNGDTGVLYKDGWAAATAKISNPETALWRSGLSGTIHNYIGKPCYSGDPYLQNTMIASLVIYKKGMTEEEVNTLFDIESTIVKLDAAYALNDGSASVRAIDLQNLVDEARDYAALAYPGLDALNTAITAAEAAIAGNNVTEEDIDDLKTAVRMYRFTQPASGAAPADFTFAIENPSFEGTFGGKLDPNSIVEGDGSYKYPTGWTLYMDKSGWCNAVDITDGPSDGTKAFETWAETIRAFDIYQDIFLPAGNYILSAEVRTNAAPPYTQHTYVAIKGDKTYSSVSLDPERLVTGGGWNAVTNFQTLSTSFALNADGNVRIGLASEGFMQFDNFRLTYFGADEPATADAPADYTFAITNPSFEDGLGGTLDTTSVLGSGDHNVPAGWNLYLNQSGWCNAVIITDAPSDGASAFETWAATINRIDLYQNIVIPATGVYRLTADVRTNTPTPYTQHVYAKTKFGTFESETLDSTSVITGDGWNGMENWQTLSAEFEAPVGMTVRAGLASQGFMQFDNFKLLYFGANDTTGVVGLGAVKALPTLMIYPNPASDFIVVSGIENNSVVKVFNVTGQQLYVRRADQNQLSIDLNGLNQGLYILQVESEGQVINSKFIKK